MAKCPECIAYCNIVLLYENRVLHCGDPAVNLHQSYSVQTLYQVSDIMKTTPVYYTVNAFAIIHKDFMFFLIFSSSGSQFDTNCEMCITLL